MLTLNLPPPWFLFCLLISLPPLIGDALPSPVHPIEHVHPSSVQTAACAWLRTLLHCVPLLLPIKQDVSIFLSNSLLKVNTTFTEQIFSLPTSSGIVLPDMGSKSRTADSPITFFLFFFIQIISNQFANKKITVH